MPILNLDKLFYPRSVAVVGACNREGMPGSVVMHNLLQGGFEGPIMPVSGSDRAIAGVLAYPRIDDLPITPDLAVICSPVPSASQVIHALGERGTRAAILLADGADPAVGATSMDGYQRLRKEAQPYGLRLLGPDCLGLIVPGIGLNASVAHVPALPGGVAFVSQSSTVCTAVLDWAREHDIGFSHFVSLGETADICFGDVIDYLGNDQMTRAILLYVDSIRNGRSFLSAGRGASRNKPILVIKSGRTAIGHATATGEHAAEGADDIYDAAIRRAGMLRVYGFTELFAAVETLARSKPLRGERLAIVSNGRGIAAMAIDTLLLGSGRLATLDEATVTALEPLVPAGRPRTNPVILDEDAPPAHYGTATKTLLADPHIDAVMVLHAPTSAVSSSKTAEAVIKARNEVRGSAVLTSWMGGSRVANARHLFAEAKIPTYETPNQAVDAFLHMLRYRRNQEILIQTPTSMPAEFTPASDRARALVKHYLSEGHNFLGGADAYALLAAYGVHCDEASPTPPPAASPVEPVRPSTTTDSPEGSISAPSPAFALAKRSAAPTVALAGGVRSHELMVRVAEDPVFGPVIIVGHGGPAAELIGDRAVALPPLNMSLAAELLSRTRVFRLLQGYGDCPPADLEALYLTVVQIAQLIVDIPEIAALEINPLVVSDQGVIAKNAQILIAPATEATERRLAIRPYPKELEEEFVMPNGRTVLLRPIRPEDEPAHHDFLALCSPEDLRLRFFHLVRRLPHSEMARLTQIDFDREMAFLATAPKEDGSGWETLGVVRTYADLHNDKAEYAILVRSDLKGQRLGWKLMEKMIRYCQSRGTQRIVGMVLCDNRKMLDLLRRLGFHWHRMPDDDVMEVELALQAPDSGDADAARPAVVH